MELERVHIYAEAELSTEQVAAMVDKLCNNPRYETINPKITFRAIPWPDSVDAYLIGRLTQAGLEEIDFHPDNLAMEHATAYGITAVVLKFFSSKARSFDL